MNSNARHRLATFRVRVLVVGLLALAAVDGAHAVVIVKNADGAAAARKIAVPAMKAVALPDRAGVLGVDWVDTKNARLVDRRSHLRRARRVAEHHARRRQAGPRHRLPEEGHARAHRARERCERRQPSDRRARRRGRGAADRADHRPRRRRRSRTRSREPRRAARRPPTRSSFDVSLAASRVFAAVAVSGAVHVGAAFVDWRDAPPATGATAVARPLRVAFAVPASTVASVDVAANGRERIVRIADRGRSGRARRAHPRRGGAARDGRAVGGRRARGRRADRSRPVDRRPRRRSPSSRRSRSAIRCSRCRRTTIRAASA